MNRKQFFALLSIVIVIAVVLGSYEFIILPDLAPKSDAIQLGVTNGYSGYNYTGDFKNISSTNAFSFQSPYANATIHETGFSNSTVSLTIIGEMGFVNPPGNTVIFFNVIVSGHLRLSEFPSGLSIYLGVSGTNHNETTAMHLQLGNNISFSNDAYYYVNGFGHTNMTMGFTNESGGNYFNFTYIPSFESDAVGGNGTDLYTITIDMKIGDYNVLTTTVMDFRDVIP